MREGAYPMPRPHSPRGRTRRAHSNVHRGSSKGSCRSSRGTRLNDDSGGGGTAAKRIRHALKPQDAISERKDHPSRASAKKLR